MAEQVVINRWCDAHLAQDETAQVEGQQHSLAIDGDSPQILDFCSECYAEKIEPLLKLLATHGQPLQKKSKPQSRRPTATAAATPRVKVGAYACPDCERTFGTPQGLGAHRYRNHGYVAPHKAQQAKEGKSAKRKPAKKTAAKKTADKKVATDEVPSS